MICTRSPAVAWILHAYRCGKTGSRLFTATACKVACRPLVAAQNGYLVTPAQYDVIAQNSRLVFFAQFSSSSTVLPNSGFGSSWRQGPLHPGLPNFQSFSAESVEWESTDASTTTELERNGATENSSSSSKVSDLAVVPAQVQAPQTSQSTIDLRDLIACKERELGVLKASLKQLELAEKLLQKQNIKFEVADENARLESPSVSGSQLETPWKTPEVKKSDNSLMFGKLSLADFPTQHDTHYEKLQRRRRRNEMLQQSARNNEVKALNFGASALSASSTEEKVSDSKAEEEPSSTEPYRPNANAFIQEKPYKSLADRLYEEQFGHPAPANLKRTYPPGSFYDRCQKDKERKEREAAAAAARGETVLEKEPESTDANNPPEDLLDRMLKRSWKSGDVRRSPRSPVSPGSTVVNRDMKPGDWKCPECSFHNFSKNVHCYKCQAERPDDPRQQLREATRRL